MANDDLMRYEIDVEFRMNPGDSPERKTYIVTAHNADEALVQCRAGLPGSDSPDFQYTILPETLHLVGRA